MFDWQFHLEANIYPLILSSQHRLWGKHRFLFWFWSHLTVPRAYFWLCALGLLLALLQGQHVMLGIKFVLTMCKANVLLTMWSLWTKSVAFLSLKAQTHITLCLAFQAQQLFSSRNRIEEPLRSSFRSRLHHGRGLTATLNDMKLRHELIFHSLVNSMRILSEQYHLCPLRTLDKVKT